MKKVSRDLVEQFDLEQTMGEFISFVVRYRSAAKWPEFVSAQVVLRFPNGFGASIIRGPLTYGGGDGKFELAELEWFADKDDDDEYVLVYELGTDVHGYLTIDKVYNLCRAIIEKKKWPWIIRRFRYLRHIIRIYLMRRQIRRYRSVG